MKILLTGDAGFIGSHLAEEFRARGHEVVGCDLQRSKIRVSEDIRALPHLQGIEAVCHQAALSSLSQSRKEPEAVVSHNILGTAHLIELAKKYRIKQFLFASTSAVYPELLGAEQARSEQDAPKPRTPYAISKLAGELLLENSGIPYAILRYGNVYGPGQIEIGDTALVPHCIRHFRQGTPFSIHGDGRKARDWVYIEDVVRANVQALEHRWGGTFNIGSGIATSVEQVCQEIASLCGATFPYPFEHSADNLWELQTMALRPAEAAIRGWRAQVPLREGLKRTIETWL